MDKSIRAGCGVLAFVLFSASAFAAPPACEDARDLVEKDGVRTYRVRDRAATLYMISRDLYGDENAWRRIAEWNGLKAPFHLRNGQRLVIQTEPRLNADEGTRALIAAWTDLSKRGKFPETSKVRIEALEACLPSKADAAPIVASSPTPAAVPTPTPVVTPSPAPIPFVPPAAEKPAPAVSPEKSAQPDAVPDVSPSPAPESEANARSPWSVSASLTSSIFNLDVIDEEHDVHADLKSKVSYGVTFGVERRLSEKWALGIGASFERIEMKPVEDAVLTNDRRNLLGFSLELEYEVADPFAISVGGAEIQRPFAEATGTGMNLDAFYIPEASLGARLRFFETPRVRGWLTGEGTYAFATHAKDYALKSDFGYAAGLRFDFKLRGETELTLAPAYRVLKVGTEGLETKQEAFLFRLGLTW